MLFVQSSQFSCLLKNINLIVLAQSSGFRLLTRTAARRTTMCALLVASSTMLVFIVVFGGGQETFQGGRHMPGMDRHMLLRLPWDPGEEFNQNLLQAQVFCESGSELPLHFKQVPVGHDFYFYLVAVYPNSGYYLDSDRIKDRRLQWGSRRVLSDVGLAWGQAKSQGWRDVRNPSNASTWAGIWASGTEHGPSLSRLGNYKYLLRRIAEEASRQITEGIYDAKIQAHREQYCCVSAQKRKKWHSPGRHQFHRLGINNKLMGYTQKLKKWHSVGSTNFID